MGSHGKHSLAADAGGAHSGFDSAATIQVLRRLNNGDILDAYGTTVPTDGVSGYSTGCIFRHTDGGSGDSVYSNEGTNESANFDLMDGALATLYLDGVTPGTVTASKAIIVGTNKNVDTLAIAKDGLKIGAGAGTAVTTTAAELNILDGATLDVNELNRLDTAIAGTAVASKAAILGAQKNLDKLVLADGGLFLGAGAGTSVTSTAAELNTLDGISAVVAELNSLYRDPGGMAAAVIHFSGVAGAAGNVTIDGVVYLEADSEDFPNGVWTNGSSAANAATSLISAINGDTRAAVPFTAVAGVDTDAVYLFWDAVGTAGNVTISTTAANTTVENSLGGAAAVLTKFVTIEHTVTTQGLLSGSTSIPIPFTPVGFSYTARNSSGLLLSITDLVTIQASPDRIQFDTDGGTTLANTDVIHLIAWA